MRTLFHLILAILSLAALAWVSWQGYLLLRREQLGLDQNTQSLVIIISILVIVSTFMLTSAIRTASDTISRGRQYQPKSVLFEQFITAWRASREENTTVTSMQSESTITDLMNSIALHAGPGVIKAVNELMRLAPGSDTADEAKDKLIIAMRADLGHTSAFYLKKDIQKLFTYKTASYGSEKIFAAQKKTQQ
jgi:hypothetical protein